VEATTDELFAIPDILHLARLTARLSVAAVLGGVLGMEREHRGKAAGLRTHMLVALGAALFTVAPLEAGMELEGLSRVIQGVAAGIGFIGAGTILKRTDEVEIQGLTTAASLWLTAAVGMAVGAGLIWPPLLAVLLAFFILHALGAIDRLRQRDRERAGGDSAEADKPEDETNDEREWDADRQNADRDRQGHQQRAHTITRNRKNAHNSS
jgi:putative Mg2+ transporter-C (MgtC) family protein